MILTVPFNVVTAESILNLAALRREVGGWTTRSCSLPLKLNTNWVLELRPISRWQRDRYSKCTIIASMGAHRGALSSADGLFQMQGGGMWVLAC